MGGAAGASGDSMTGSTGPIGARGAATGSGTPSVVSSAASMRSLLVTPSSLASSMTFILVAATAPSPPDNSLSFYRGPRHRVVPSRELRDPRAEVRRHAARRAERVRQSLAPQSPLDAWRFAAHIGSASGPRSADV